MTDLGEISPCYTVTFARAARHPATRLWRAITDPEEVSRWMTYPARIDLRVGGHYFVDFGRTGGGSLDGVIVRVEPERTLAYVWGMSVLEWRLEPGPDGCRYAFVHHGQAAPEDTESEDIAAGWHLWLDDLEAHLAGREPNGGASREASSRLVPVYRARRDAVLGLTPRA